MGEDKRADREEKEARSAKDSPEEEPQIGSAWNDPVSRQREEVDIDDELPDAEALRAEEESTTRPEEGTVIAERAGRSRDRSSPTDERRHKPILAPKAKTTPAPSIESEGTGSSVQRG